MKSLSVFVMSFLLILLLFNNQLYAQETNKWEKFDSFSGNGSFFLGEQAISDSNGVFRFFISSPNSLSEPVVVNEVNLRLFFAAIQKAKNFSFEKQIDKVESIDKNVLLVIYSFGGSVKLEITKDNLRVSCILLPNESIRLENTLASLISGLNKKPSNKTVLETDDIEAHGLAPEVTGGPEEDPGYSTSSRSKYKTGGSVSVKSYRRKDGTYVHSHTRARRGSGSSGRRK